MTEDQPSRRRSSETLDRALGADRLRPLVQRVAVRPGASPGSGIAWPTSGPGSEPSPRSRPPTGHEVIAVEPEAAFAAHLRAALRRLRIRWAVVEGAHRRRSGRWSTRRSASTCSSTFPDDAATVRSDRGSPRLRAAACSYSSRPTSAFFGGYDRAAGHLRRYSKARVRDLLREAGFNRDPPVRQPGRRSPGWLIRVATSSPRTRSGRRARLRPSTGSCRCCALDRAAAPVRPLAVGGRPQALAVPRPRTPTNSAEGPSACRSDQGRPGHHDPQRVGIVEPPEARSFQVTARTPTARARPRRGGRHQSDRSRHPRPIRRRIADRPAGSLGDPVPAGRDEEVHRLEPATTASAKNRSVLTSKVTFPTVRCPG